MEGRGTQESHKETRPHSIPYVPITPGEPDNSWDTHPQALVSGAHWSQPV